MRGVDVLDCTAATTQHLTLKEIDQILKKRGDGKEPVEIHAWLEKERARKGLQAPHLTNVRRVLTGSTYRRGKAETRGRKKALTEKQVRKIDGVRKRLIKRSQFGSTSTRSQFGAASSQ